MENETCRCTLCGYQWKKGADGSHSCADVLEKKHIELLIKAKKFFDEVMPQIGSLTIEDRENIKELKAILKSGEKFFIRGE